MAGGSTGGFPLWRRGRRHVHPLRALAELPPPRPSTEQSKERSSSEPRALLGWVSGNQPLPSFTLGPK